MAGFPLAQWCELDLLRKSIGSRQVAVAFDQCAAENKHRIFRRRNLCHALRYGSIPAGSADQVFAGLGPRGAFSYVGKNSVFSTDQ